MSFKRAISRARSMQRLQVKRHGHSPLSGAHEIVPWRFSDKIRGASCSIKSRDPTREDWTRLLCQRTLGCQQRRKNKTILPLREQFSMQIVFAEGRGVKNRPRNFRKARVTPA
jgi:hypothetical protein